MRTSFIRLKEYGRLNERAEKTRIEVDIKARQTRMYAEQDV